MRGLLRPLAGLLILLSAPLLAGCIDPPTEDAPTAIVPLTSLEVYEYRYEGDAVAFAGFSYGWMARLSNPGDHHVAFVVVPLANETLFGPAGNTSWETFDAPTPDVLAPGESKVYLFQQTFANVTNETGFRIDVIDASDLEADAAVSERGVFRRGIHYSNEGMIPITAGQHVQTATVGVWLNGTSFYTNIPDLNASAEFPAGFNRSGVADAPLPIYVYDKDRSEQPAGSKDTCHFTTITGYNALLKTQVAEGTNVRWLAPEEAYTRPGAEDHHLYGDVLIFMNTIVQHDGGVGPAGRPPAPQGKCFDVNNTSPVPVPPPVWTP